MNTKPQRIQRRRTKGWQMPENTVYVGRPSPWGNPWAKTTDGQGNTHRLPGAEAVDCFRRWVPEMLDIKPDWLAPLRGKNLACWCPPGQPCHVDVLLELANRES